MSFSDWLDAKIRTLLTEEAGAFADSARGKAPTGRIRGNIEVGQVRKDGGRYSIEVSVSLKKAPEAGAYEYGSGIHATRGTPGTYPIVAKNAPNLVFWWEKKDKWFVGSSVNHPGVAARPYLAPAVKERRRSLIRRILFAFKEGVNVAVKEATTGKL